MKYTHCRNHDPRTQKVRGIQGTHCTEKTGKVTKKNPCQGKRRELEFLAKTQGIWFAQVVNSMIPKVKDISKFAAKISIIFLKLDRSAASVLCMK